MTRHFFLFKLLASTLFLGGCSLTPTKSVNETAIDNKQDTVKTEPVDYSAFEYKLPKSNYTYKVKITGINTKPAKDAFTTKADDYAIPQKVDGYYLTITFSITNPYDKEMLAPIPNYYYITSNNNERFSGSSIFHRDCQCDIDNSTELTTDKGQKLYEISEGKCGYSDHCIRFQPQETKNFILNFTDPIFVKVRQLAFWGFDRKWNNPSYTREQDLGIILDVDKKEVTGEKNF